MSPDRTGERIPAWMIFASMAGIGASVTFLGFTGMLSSDAIAGLFGGMVGILTILVETLRRRVSAVGAQVDEVHTLVNSTHDDAIARIAQLIKSLERHNIAVPDDKAG